MNGLLDHAFPTEGNGPIHLWKALEWSKESTSPENGPVLWETSACPQTGNGEVEENPPDFPGMVLLNAPCGSMAGMLKLRDRGILPRPLPAVQISGMQKCNLAAFDSGPFQAKEIASEAS